MRVIVQRSNHSSVSVDEKISGEIKRGMVLLVGFTHQDTLEDIKKMVQKIIHLRIFDDEFGIMNLSILDSGGEILSISQFTLYANTKKGNRPSYIAALNGEDAVKLYDAFNEELKKYIPVKTGIFGADMKVHIENDGPVTILLETNHE